MCAATGAFPLNGSGADSTTGTGSGCKSGWGIFGSTAGRGQVAEFITRRRVALVGANSFAKGCKAAPPDTVRADLRPASRMNSRPQEKSAPYLRFLHLSQVARIALEP
ncbi:hypothetical protein PCA10_19330 [Metapseudomonas resinovorans NBRC 106553]|uniref:Uncharacterized protein n=1 Tax=Metapseudomonas resinovorans NBRC 106553 TaxID=1245471 RepID=S6AHD7_METRE|nr:hypothetical protein PCA10_19330 [Pseudomonas resinovorans NBRC 106553]